MKEKTLLVTVVPVICCERETLSFPPQTSGVTLKRSGPASFHVQVLDAGRIHAYDAPSKLLQDPDGIFSKMVQQTGKQEAAALHDAAKKVRRPRPPARLFDLWIFRRVALTSRVSVSACRPTTTT